MEDTFWQANFWGITGTISGALGLLISWLNWRYSKPKIDIAKLELETPYLSHINDYKIKPRAQEYWAEFVLHVRFRNKKGGSGSIEKPLLILKYKIGSRFYFLAKFKECILKPRTKHTEWQKESESVSVGHMVRHGEAWNFSGGQTIDDELEYMFRGAEFYDFASNWEKVRYFIEYNDNFGRRFCKQIKNVREKQ